MRTRKELEIEARRLEQLARDARQEPRGSGAAPLTDSGFGEKPLFTFPDSSVEIDGGSEFGSRLLHRMVRHISIAEGRAGFEYRLIEEEFFSDTKGAVVRHYDPIVIRTSDDAFDILSAGYQRLDEDRLLERIESLISRIEPDGFADSEHADALAEVDRAVSDLNLSMTARMRMKVDTIDLLEGRLEMGDFVARTVARQDCFEIVQRVVLSRQNTESIEV